MSDMSDNHHLVIRFFFFFLFWHFAFLSSSPLWLASGKKA
jgi:hypothetical protein